jgi:hypothetical protein
MRRGEVGGYRDYLTARDVAFLEERMRRLDDHYGYGDVADAR